MQSKKLRPWEQYAAYLLPVLFIAIDYLAVAAAELLSYQLRQRWIPVADSSFYIPAIYLFGIVPFIFLGFLYAMRTYTRNLPFWIVVQKIFWACVYAVLLVILLMYFAQVGEVVSRLFVVLTGMFAVLFLWIGRYACRKCIYSLRLLHVPVLFIGAGLTAERVLRSFQYDAGFAYRVVGFLDDHPVSEKIAATYPILGGFDDAEQVIRETGVRDIIITAPGLRQEAQVRLINRIQPLVTRVIVAPNLIGIPMGRLTAMSLVSEKIVLLETHNNLRSAFNRITKRIFDLVVSLVGLIAILPLLAILAVMIYIDDPGQIIFVNCRVGQGGRIFPCYKFRSMVMKDGDAILERYLAENADERENWEVCCKLKHDPRVTQFGRFLRRTSLDELPQIFNVLCGDMSLVGPRPILEREIERYGDLIADYHLVRPGITGLWQISGRANTTFEERVQMDSWYIRNWSIWLDFVYLLKTVQVVFKKEGAY